MDKGKLVKQRKAQSLLFMFLFLRSSTDRLNIPKPKEDGVLSWPYVADSGAPNDNFRKNICSEDDLRSRIFGNICCKISCSPASPRIFGHLKNGIIAYF